MEHEEEGRRSKEKKVFLRDRRNLSVAWKLDSRVEVKDRRKERSEELCSRELSYVCDFPLRLIDG